MSFFLTDIGIVCRPSVDRYSSPSYGCETEKVEDDFTLHRGYVAAVLRKKMLEEDHNSPEASPGTDASRGKGKLPEAPSSSKEAKPNSASASPLPKPKSIEQSDQPRTKTAQPSKDKQKEVEDRVVKFVEHHKLIRDCIVTNVSGPLWPLLPMLVPNIEVIQVHGLCVVGTPVGTSDYVREYVRNKCGTICKDVETAQTPS